MDVNIEFVEGGSMEVQGTWDEVVKRYGKDWNIKPLGNGNGNWLLTKNSNVLVNGKSCRGFVLDYYERSKLTKKLADRFRNDVENGIIKISEILEWWKNH